MRRGSIWTGCIVLGVALGFIISYFTSYSVGMPIGATLGVGTAFIMRGLVKD